MTRNYIKTPPMADWLREFATKELKQGTSVNESIQDIFNLNGSSQKNELDAVEAKVNEIRERVGLDKLEKTAVIRQVEKAKERGEGTVKKWCVYPKKGGKALGCHSKKEDAERQLRAIEWSEGQDAVDEYYVKDEVFGGFGDDQKDNRYDKEQLEKGIKVEMEHTNDPEKAKEIVKDHLEESKDFKGEDGGKYYDRLDDMEEEIKKHLVKKQSQIQKLIRVANELEKTGDLNTIRYIDIQIKKLADDIAYAPTDLDNPNAREKTQNLRPPKQIKKEPKQKMQPAKWYALIYNGSVLGFVSGKSKAYMVQNEIAHTFGNRGVNGLSNMFGQLVNKSISADPLTIRYYMAMTDDEDFPLSSSERRSFVPNFITFINDLKTHERFGDSRSFLFRTSVLIVPMAEGFEPSETSVIKGDLPTDENIMSANKDFDAGFKGTEELLNKLEPIIQENIGNFTQEAYDGFKLSSRQTVFDKYPNVKTHIDNVCQSRDGFINEPALNHKIFSGKESFDDKEREEIKKYIKDMLKESRKNVDISSKDDINVGKYEQQSIDISDDDDKVF